MKVAPRQLGVDLVGRGECEASVARLASAGDGPAMVAADHHRLWGPPDGAAWERAHARSLAPFTRFSDIREERLVALADLEAVCCR